MRKTIVIGISLLFFIGMASQAFSARKIHCWDLNENYQCDIETEDMNVDDKCNVHDCETVEPEEPPCPIPQTGQEISDATGDDGDLQMGVPWPNPRFTDNGDGTVIDNLTGLMWAKNANIYGTRTWSEALSDCASCSEGGYTNWYLPNVRQLHSLIHFGYNNPALPNTVGTDKWSNNDPFTGVASSYYWSSTANVVSIAALAWAVHLDGGYVDSQGKTLDNYVWCVRDAK